MDVLAAIALSTEAPHPTKLRAERIKKNDKILTPLMWRAVTSQALYQAIVMLVLLFAGPAMFGISYNLIKTPLYKGDSMTPTYHLQHNTFMFQTFMMMNLFNMFNCRKLGSEQDPMFNVFEGIHRNWWFLIVFLAEINLQFLMVGYSGSGKLFMTTPITLGMHLTAFFLGLGSLAVAAIVKKTPNKWLEMFPQLNESEEEAKLPGGYQEAFEKSKTAILMEED